MKASLLLAVVALSGCTASKQRVDECPQVEPSSRNIERLNAAAQRAGAPAVDLHSLSYCRQRRDGTLYAKWIVSRFDSIDTARQWDNVWCSHEPSPGSGWTCGTQRLRAVNLTMPDSRHFTQAIIPLDMPSGEGRRLSLHGLAQWPSLTVANACHWNRTPAANLAQFREHAAKDGQWKLEPQGEAGRFRLLRDELYYIDFHDPATPSAGDACWGILEVLE